MATESRRGVVDDATVPAEGDADRRESLQKGLRLPGRPDDYYRNLYKSETDFSQLGRRDPEFGALLKNNGQLDFSDPRAVKQLTKTLLKVDFGLVVELPDDRLCPPVPNRHNYILWLKELLDSTSYSEPGRRLSGVDIGTGAGCIYPLLGTAQRPWYFVATDIDSTNLDYAQRNVELNGLQDRIRVVGRGPSDPLIGLNDLGVRAVDFVMTNPPFYVSEDEMLSSARQKARPPYSACTGATVEMVCDGGEMGFAGRILDESLVLRERVQWYTSMFGKASSAETFVGRLRESGIDNYAVAEFVQGSKTRRWAVGWSFGSMRPSQAASRGIGGARAGAWKKLLPPCVDADLCTTPSRQGIGRLADRINDAIRPLELISWEWNAQTLSGVGRARENVWSRAWRRKKMREAAEGPGSAQGGGSDGAEACAFGFLVTIDVGREVTTARVRWAEGHDEILFESFTGFLKGHLRRNKDG